MSRLKLKKNKPFIPPLNFVNFIFPQTKPTFKPHLIVENSFGYFTLYYIPLLTLFKSNEKLIQSYHTR